MQESTGFSPFELDIGRHPATPCALLGRLAQFTGEQAGMPAQRRADRRCADDFVAEMRQRLDLARRALLRAQETAERAAAMQGVGMEFAAGDYVFLRRDASSAVELLKKEDKLAPVWHPEPLRVSERVGENSYRLVMPKTWRRHPVVNVSKLKPAGPHRPSVTDADATGDGNEPLLVQSLLVHRDTGSAGHRRLKVRPRGLRPLLAQTFARRAGFEPLRRFLASAEMEGLPDHLGRLVRKEFTDDTSDEPEPRLFDGVVIAYDPADHEQQFEVLYEDDDVEWLPESSLRRILVPSTAAGPQERRLAALALSASQAGVSDRP